MIPLKNEGEKQMKMNTSCCLQLKINTFQSGNFKFFPWGSNYSPLILVTIVHMLSTWNKNGELPKLRIDIRLRFEDT